MSVLQLGFSKEANLYLQAGGVHKNTVRSTAVTPIDENEYIRVRRMEYPDLKLLTS